MLMIAILVVVLSMAWAAAVIAGYLVAAHRARSIADLAAISGAATVLQGGDGCSAVRRIVERQGATAACSQVGDAIDFVVTVTAQVRVPITFPGLPSEVSGTGHAGPTATGTTQSSPR